MSEYYAQIWNDLKCNFLCGELMSNMDTKWETLDNFVYCDGEELAACGSHELAVHIAVCHNAVLESKPIMES